jgi:hypothetical protein
LDAFGVFIASEPLGHLRDLLLLVFDELLEVGDLLAPVVGRDSAAVAVVAAPTGGDQIRGSQNRCGACELGARWWTVVA